MGKKQSKKKKQITALYDIKEKLGTGSFAVVKRAVEKKTGKEFAVKIIKKKNLQADELATINDEVEIMSRTDHEHIVKMFDMFDNTNYLYMVLELLTGGELFERIVEKEFYSEREAADAIRQVTLAVKYMHDTKIVHRDLKPENLLYSSKDPGAKIKVTDFGLAKYIRSSGDNELRTPCGTPGYVAPEILKSEPYGPAVDMWSIGVILYILLCGFPPFYDDTAQGLYEQIKKGDYEFPDPYWTDITAGAKDLVQKLLTVDPKQRCTAEELLKHPWVVGGASDRQFGAGFNKKLQAFNARRKLRQAITTVLAANKLARTIGIDFTDFDEAKE